MRLRHSRESIVPERSRHAATADSKVATPDRESVPAECGPAHSGAGRARPLAPVTVREAPPEVRAPTPRPSSWALTIVVGSTLTFFAVALFARDWGEAALQSASLAIVLGVVCLLTGLVYLVSGLRRHWLAWLVARALFTALGVFELALAGGPLRLLLAHGAARWGGDDEACTPMRLTR